MNLSVRHDTNQLMKSFFKIDLYTKETNESSNDTVPTKMTKTEKIANILKMSCQNEASVDSGDTNTVIKLKALVSLLLLSNIYYFIS